MVRQPTRINGLAASVVESLGGTEPKNFVQLAIPEPYRPLVSRCVLGVGYMNNQQNRILPDRLGGARLEKQSRIPMGVEGLAGGVAVIHVCPPALPEFQPGGTGEDCQP